jgi:hypothetical protein
LALLVDIDESARIDASSLWNFKGDDFRHMWKFATYDEKCKFLDRARENMLAMEETKTGMYYCPEIDVDRLAPEGMSLFSVGKCHAI